MMPDSQAAFLFGSGISFPSGMPSVQEITRAVFEDEWHIHTDCTFHPGPYPNPQIPDELTPVLKKFLLQVADCAADYLAEGALPSAGRKPHYEDFFSLAEQASRAETDHVRNLAAVEFVRRLRRETVTLHNGFKGGTSGGEGFAGLASSACDFLHWVVEHKLHVPGADRKGLEAISQVASKVTALDIFTLNHDLLVEQQLRADGIGEVESGFEDRFHGSALVYRPGWWGGAEREKVRLFKLHGSTNWWLLDFPEWGRQYAIPRGDPRHQKDRNGKWVQPVDWKAAFLSGTIVKELHYDEGIWAEMFAAFKVHLARHRNLICCGYGFGDTGVNRRIRQWMDDRQDKANRLVILTPVPPAAYFEDKPLWLMRMFTDGRVEIVPNYLEKTTVDDLRPFFDPL